MPSSSRATSASRWLRRLAVAAFILGVVYLAGGSDGYRWLRARIRAALQPPTADQMQRAPVDTAVPLRATLPPEAVRGRMWLSDPPRPLAVAVVLTSIITSAFLMMFFTGRSAPRGPDAS